MGRAFSSSYLADDSSAFPFFHPSFRSSGERIARARLAAKKILSPSLIEILQDQQAALPPSRARIANIQGLANGQTAVVVTGQQIGLFLGPLYAFYKAASAIAVARTIEAESGIRCVPLFWLQTEDHDFAEIRSCNILDQDGKPLRLTLSDEGGDKRVSVAYRPLPDQITSLVEALAEALEPSPAKEATLAWVRTAYQPGRSMAQAFADLLATMFADEGLLIFNPREARVAALAAPVFQVCLDDALAIEQLLRERRNALHVAGFKEQVAIRERGALIFFHQNAANGPRFRLIRQSMGEHTRWSLAGTNVTISLGDIANFLAAEPLRFSSSALLRPVLQDTLFPTVAYVAGPGEINYFAQIEPLYAHFGLVPPLLVPRAHFRCLNARTRRQLKQVGLTAAELELPKETRQTRSATSVPIGAQNPAELRALLASQIAPAFEAIAASVSTAGNQLTRPIFRARNSIFHTLNRLIQRYENQLLERDEISNRRIQQLELELIPQGIPQERFYGWPSLAGRVGPQEFKQMVLEKLQSTEAFSTEIRDLEL